jgi:hypothetical protein
MTVFAGGVSSRFLILEPYFIVLSRASMVRVVDWLLIFKPKNPFPERSYQLL